MDDEKEILEEAEASVSEKPEKAGKRPKKRRAGRKKFRIVMAFVTLIFVGLAGVSLYFAELIRDKREECLMTRMPSGLDAVDTVKQYFKYWDEGNNEGMYQAAIPDENQDPVSSDQSFNLGLCYFCDVELTRAEKVDMIAEGYEGCYESAIISVDFTYRTKLGFGDKTIPEDNKNWEFYLAKIDQGDDFKIINVVRPESR